MGYINIVNTVVSVIFTIFFLLTVHFFFFAIVGVFKRKTFPKTDTKLKYGIIIPARNEEAVVANLIESIYKNKYPQDKLHVFVIAHNCTDNTAKVARATGATVYEYNNPEECTMGYAFRYLFDRIKEDYGTENYDGFFLFNADNIVSENYFEKMNDAFVACDKKNVITSFRNSKNFGSNVMSAMYGLYFMYGCRFESRGRTALGCSTRVQGTGYVVNSDTVKDGWKYVTLTEDWEFTADQILQDTRIMFCDEAVFYDEQPTTLKVMWRQRLRWSRGHLLVCLTRFKDLLKALFTPKKKGGAKHKFSTFDILINILPVCVIASSVVLLQIIALFLSPLFGYNLIDVIIAQFKSNIVQQVASFALLVVASIVIYVVERKRIKNVSFGIKTLSVLLWPIFLFISVPSEIIALFAKNLGWKAIPHTDTTNFNALHEEASAEETAEVATAEKIDDNIEGIEVIKPDMAEMK